MKENIYYKNSHSINPLLSDRQKAQQEKANQELKQNIERLQMKLEPLCDDLATLQAEMKGKKQYISTMQMRVHRKRCERLKTEIQHIQIQIDSLTNKNK